MVPQKFQYRPKLGSMSNDQPPKYGTSRERYGAPHLDSFAFLSMPLYTCCLFLNIESSKFVTGNVSVNIGLTSSFQKSSGSFFHVPNVPLNISSNLFNKIN